MCSYTFYIFFLFIYSVFLLWYFHNLSFQKQILFFFAFVKHMTATALFVCTAYGDQ